MFAIEYYLHFLWQELLIPKIITRICWKAGWKQELGFKFDPC